MFKVKWAKGGKEYTLERYKDEGRQDIKMVKKI